MSAPAPVFASPSPPQPGCLRSVPVEVFFLSDTPRLTRVLFCIHFSLCDLRNHESRQSQLSCHHQNGLWLQAQRWHLVWSHYIQASSSWIPNLALVPPQGDIYLCGSHPQVRNLLVWRVPGLLTAPSSKRPGRRELQLFFTKPLCYLYPPEKLLKVLSCIFFNKKSRVGQNELRNQTLWVVGN